MTRLPRGLSGRQVRRALERAGFYLKRRKGSHMVQEAREHLATATTMYREMDMGFWLAQAETELEAARGEDCPA